MYGLSGGCEELEGRSALDLYRAALQLVPQNTLALTHVAYGDREPCAAETTERLMCSDGGDAAAECPSDADGLDTTGAPPPSVASWRRRSPRHPRSAMATATSRRAWTCFLRLRRHRA